ncbi:response regulator [Planctomycetota bacterium]
MSDNKKIMVVDDDLDILDQLEAILKTEGYEVLTASGEEEAESLLLTIKPDLVILDLMMEHMDSGFVLAHNLKKLYPATPMILLTSVSAATGISFSTQSSQAQSWLKTDLLLDKPIRPEQIKTEVSRLLMR